MAPESKVTKMPVRLFPASGPAGKGGGTPRRTGGISLTAPSVDLATKLRLFQRTLRSRVERRDAFLDMVRAVNTTLEPVKIAEFLLERAESWLPAPYWSVVCSDQSGELTVLAERGLARDTGPAVTAIARWVMD